MVQIGLLQTWQKGRADRISKVIIKPAFTIMKPKGESVTIKEKDDQDSVIITLLRLNEIPRNIKQTSQTTYQTTIKCSNLYRDWNNLLDDVKIIHRHVASMF